MDGLTVFSNEMLDALEKGFVGPRPGSNFFPLLSLHVAGEELDGERIEELVRAGHLSHSPVQSETFVSGGDCGPYGIIPDIDLTHKYFLTSGARAALSNI